MTDGRGNSFGWIPIQIKDETENRAKQMRAERDKKYGNIFSEFNTDERWVGDLGEIALDYWFTHKGIRDVKWIVDDAAGKADFITPSGTRIGAKTVKRKVAPQPDFTAQITAKHANEPVDQLFFMTYQIQERCMWLLGGISKDIFLREAIYYPAGEWVHPNYQVRQGHEIYNIGIDKLAAPADWIRSVL